MKSGSAFHVSRVALMTAAFVCLGGCGIPDSMHVRMGGEPRHQDDDVLFRTTYYFRVFDFCDGQQGAGQNKRIKSDSLYRFKMTGKAKSTFSHVRFESGTLQAWQIDPLGAAVEFDKETGKPYFVSQQKREEMLKQDRHYTEVGRLRSLLDALRCETAAQSEQCAIVNTKIAENLRLIGPGGAANLAYEIKWNALSRLREAGMAINALADNQKSKDAVEKIRKQLLDHGKEIEAARDVVELRVAMAEAKSYVQSLGTEDGVKGYSIAPSGNPDNDAGDQKYMNQLGRALDDLDKAVAAPGAAGGAAGASGKALVCGDGMPARRGFQILGPEGWRTFDQDERLVLAMSSTGKPLLDALRDVSSRAMARKSQGLAQETVLTGYLAIAQARAKLGDIENAEPDKLAAALDAAVEAFVKQGGK